MIFYTFVATMHGIQKAQKVPLSILTTFLKKHVSITLQKKQTSTL
jgi:hypothetical protein